MKTYNFNHKAFYLVDNSFEGKVNKDTQFKHTQEDGFITGTYEGGPIILGSIIATLDKNKLTMLYHCLTVNNELKAGKAIAQVSFVNNENIQLELKWEWIGNHSGEGTSTNVEL